MKKCQTRLKRYFNKKALKNLQKNYRIMSDQPDLIGLQISDFQQKNEDAKRLCRESRDHYLFSTQKNSHFTANTATQHLQRLYARAGIVRATSHSGRRTWLTDLSSKGVGVRVLAEMAGHASIQTTQRYIDVNDEQMRRAAELI